VKALATFTLLGPFAFPPDEIAAIRANARHASRSPFGAQEQRRAWGLIRSQDTTAARAHTVGAAHQEQRALEARAQAPHPSDLARADFAVRRAEVRWQELMPAQVRELAQWATAPHQAVAGHLIQGFNRLLKKGHRRGLRESRLWGTHTRRQADAWTGQPPAAALVRH
jgi:hypothetical protein